MLKKDNLIVYFQNRNYKYLGLPQYYLFFYSGFVDIYNMHRSSYTKPIHESHLKVRSHKYLSFQKFFWHYKAFATNLKKYDEDC